MDVEARIDELFSLPLEEFTAARNKLVGQLKKDDPSEAARVKALKKPTSTVWAVNQLAHRHGPELEELVALHEKMTSSKDATNLRAASRERKRIVGRLTDLALEELSAAGHKPTSTTSQRITQTLIAAAAGEELDALRWGRLTADVDSPGFGALEGFEAAADSAIYNRPDQRAAERRATLERQAEEAEKVADELTRAADKAQLEADRIAAQAEKAREQAGSARAKADNEADI